MGVTTPAVEAVPETNAEAEAGVVPTVANAGVTIEAADKAGAVITEAQVRMGALPRAHQNGATVVAGKPTFHLHRVWAFLTCVCVCVCVVK